MDRFCAFSRPTAEIGRFIRSCGAIAAVEFALIMPILVALMVGGLELVRYVNTTRQLTNLAQSIGTLLSERTTALNYYDAVYTYNSTLVSFPAVLADAARKKTSWTFDLAVTLSSVSFTPTTSGCTSGCTYKAAVDWSINSPTAATRSCSVPPVSAADTASPSLTTLPVDVYTSGSLLVVDLSFLYTPLFGASFVPPITIKRSAYLQPRYLPKVGYSVVAGDPGYKACS